MKQILIWNNTKQCYDVKALNESEQKRVNKLLTAFYNAKTDAINFNVEKKNDINLLHDINKRLVDSANALEKFGFKMDVDSYYLD